MDIKDIYNIEDIKKSLDGEELIMRKIYILKEAVSSEELVRDKYLTKFGNKRLTYFGDKLRRQQVKEFYRKQQQIIENKEIIKTFEHPYTKTSLDSKMGVVAGTDISTPVLYDSVIRSYFGDYKISAHFCETATTNGLFNVNDCFCDLAKTNIISFSHEDRKATTEEIENYLHKLSDENEYLYLITKLADCLSSCQFNRYYTTPPYLPKKINQFLESQKDRIKTSSKAIKEQTGLYSSNTKTILDIKKQLSVLPDTKKAYYLDKLNHILENVEQPVLGYLSIFDTEYNRQINLRTELFNLLAEIDTSDKCYQPELLQQYLDQLTQQPSQKQDTEEQVKNIFFVINYLEEHKEEGSFDTYQQMQDKIATLLVTTLLQHDSLRDEILPELSSVYQTAVYLKLRDMLAQYTSDNKEALLTTYPLLYDSSIEESEFITKSLNILSESSTPAQKKKK